MIQKLKDLLQFIVHLLLAESVLVKRVAMRAAMMGLLPNGDLKALSECLAEG